MPEAIYPWGGKITLDLRFDQVSEIPASGQHSIKDGESRWVLFFKTDGAPRVNFSRDEAVRLRCSDGPWAQGTYQKRESPEHGVVGDGPAPFPSGAPTRFLLQADTSKPESEALAPLPRDAGAMETARLHLDALRAEVNRLLDGETTALEAGLLDGLVVELDELSDYIDGQLGVPPSQTDHPRSVTKALDFLRRAANSFSKSGATEALRLAREIATLLAILGEGVDLDVSQLPDR